MAHHLSRREQLDKERKNPAEEDPEFQIAPMIDILLVLLVFFMSISSTEVLQANKEVSLPVAKDGKDASKNNPGQVIINVTWVAINNAGGIEVDGDKYTAPDLMIPKLQRVITANPLARVLIRADKSVRYEYLRSIMKSVALAGVQNVTFSVVNQEKPS